MNRSRLSYSKLELSVRIVSSHLLQTYRPANLGEKWLQIIKGRGHVGSSMDGTTQMEDLDGNDHQVYQDMPARKYDDVVQSDWNFETETNQDLTSLDLEQWLDPNYFTTVDMNANKEHAEGSAEGHMLSPPLYASLTNTDWFKVTESEPQPAENFQQPNWTDVELRVVVQKLQLE